MGFSGPLAIMYTEIKAYAELLEEPLDKWDVGTLRAMDQAYLEEVRAMDKGK